MKMNRVFDVRSVVHSILGVLGKSGGRASVIIALELTEGFKLDISQCDAELQLLSLRLRLACTCMLPMRGQHYIT